MKRTTGYGRRARTGLGTLGVLIALGGGVLPSASYASPPRPWRLGESLGSPNWLDLGIAHRTRFEYLANPVRGARAGGVSGLFLRTNLTATLKLQPLAFSVELVDSRLYVVEGDPTLDSSLGNPLDILALNLALDMPDLFLPGAHGRLRVGRMTLDLGSRRLAARNRFRNTINAFSGADFRWLNPSHCELRAFALLPLNRQPDDESGLRANDIELDREAIQTVFGGLHLGSNGGEMEIRWEGYLLGLAERDEPGVPTRDRRLWTPGFRVHRAPVLGRVDFDVEGALQLGQSRATAAADDDRDLNHQAVFFHVGVGHTSDAGGSIRVALAYDYASGDADPSDGTHGRFDTLYGARRFEFGPTGLFGALARSNISTPELRVESAPLPALSGFVAYRPVWLAQARDAWTTSRIRDPTGQAGNFVGHQLEARLRWRPVSGNVMAEVGFAHGIWGEFVDVAKSGQLDSTFIYTQLGLTI